MTFRGLLAALNRWRAGPFAILPLSFLGEFAIGFTELSGLYVMRQIHCDAHRDASQRVWIQPYPPAEDICRSAEVQRAYSTSIAIYLSIGTIVSILMSGTYGRLSDMRGRKYTMATAATIFALSDLWLFLCVQFQPLRQIRFVLLAALLKGLAGGWTIFPHTHTAFIADTSPAAKRSSFIALSLVTTWLASAIAPLISGFLLNKGLFAINFGIAAALWATYLSYLVLILRETRVPQIRHEAVSHAEIPEHEPQRWSLKTPFRKVAEPLIIIFSDGTLRWLGTAAFVMYLALGVMSILVMYCDRVLGLSPSEAAVIISSAAVSRAVSVLCILPVFIAVYRRFFLPHKALSVPSSGRADNEDLAVDTPTESTALLSRSNTGPQDATLERTAAVKQELLVCPTFLLLDMAGMFLVSLSRNAAEVTMAASIGALGAPANPSLQALVTLAAPPDVVGRVLAGISILQSLSIGLRNPILFTLYNATLESAPFAVWWLSAGLFAFCAIIVASLRPSNFRADDRLES